MTRSRGFRIPSATAVNVTARDAATCHLGIHCQSGSHGTDELSWAPVKSPASLHELKNLDCGHDLEAASAKPSDRNTLLKWKCLS